MDLSQFLSKTAKTGSCWLWLGSVNKDGYGKTKLAGKHMTTHRLSWIFHRGPIPEGLEVLHTCDNPPCVNPDHLWLGTNLDNQRDAAEKGRHAGYSKSPVKLAATQINCRKAAIKAAELRRSATHCKNGHEYLEENIYSYKGERHCKLCRQAADRRRRAK
jgi:hypothetical protein